MMILVFQIMSGSYAYNFGNKESLFSCLNNKVQWPQATSTLKKSILRKISENYQNNTRFELAIDGDVEGILSETPLFSNFHFRWHFVDKIKRCAESKESRAHGMTLF